MTSEDTINNCKSKMKKAFDIFNTDLGSLRTGRANVAMLDIIKVDVYGQKMSINQLATISTPEPRLLTVQVWDQNNVSVIDAAIKKSNLGINPQIDGQLMRIPIPSLNEERRMELKKVERMGAKSFEQAAGFLRISNGKNPLDNTTLHPENYDIAKQIAKDLNLNLEELVGNERVKETNPINYQDEERGAITI